MFHPTTVRPATCRIPTRYPLTSHRHPTSRSSTLGNTSQSDSRPVIKYTGANPSSKYYFQSTDYLVSDNNTEEKNVSPCEITDKDNKAAADRFEFLLNRIDTAKSHGRPDQEDLQNPELHVEGNENTRDSEVMPPGDDAFAVPAEQGTIELSAGFLIKC